MAANFSILSNKQLIDWALLHGSYVEARLAHIADMLAIEVANLERELEEAQDWV